MRRWSTRTFGLVLLPLALLAGCGDGTADGEGAAEGGEMEEAAAPADTESQGTLVLGDLTYDVLVRPGRCNLDDPTDREGNTVSGRVVGPDGERMILEVSRAGMGHAVMISGGGSRWSAERQQMGGRWSDARFMGTERAAETPNEPLIRISGDTVRAEGLFEGAEDEVRFGSLEVVCSR